MLKEEYLKKGLETGFNEAVLIIEKDANLRQCKSFEELHNFCDANYLLFDFADFEKNGFNEDQYLIACNALIEKLDLYLKQGEKTK